MKTRRSSGRESIGKDRINLRDKHKQDVYDALYALGTYHYGKARYTGQAKVKQIWWWLTERNKALNKETEAKAQAVYESGVYNWTKADMFEQVRLRKKKTISTRTIERCLKNDPRIVKKGWYYHIDYEARLESRYLRPRMFGIDMWRAIEQSRPNMSELIRRIGAMVVFNFIEAVRPFQDKSMTLAERANLIDYWAKNALPLDLMFQDFCMYFVHGDQWVETKPRNEIDDYNLNQTLEMFKQACPDLYAALHEARRMQVMSHDWDKFVRVSGDKWALKAGEKPSFIHGKTHHIGWDAWLSYLEKEDYPISYKHEKEIAKRLKAID